MKKFSSLFLVSLLSGATTIGAYKLFIENDALVVNKPTVTVAPANYMKQAAFKGEAVDFTEAADQAVHAVVHVKNVSYRTVSNPIMEFFYGYRGGQQQEQIGTGSGVIISEDGYIVTNNHVVKDASNLEITLNDNSIYKAKLIGTDSKMDIALLKIDADHKLPYAVFADSDHVKVGEWVLAVGNPYNLTSTVTAGIVSAKARNLGTDGIQSFIQTDAAVNPGNSGGALVNTRGELVGINTMISSMTGSYVGYSFAVPSNITRKIIEDIMEFGNVQRGILGVQGAALSAPVSKEIGVKQTSGFYVSSVDAKSGAEKAGLKKGDIIIRVDDKAVNTYSDLATYLNTKRPSDKVQVTFIRNDETKSTSVQLTKSESIKGFDLEEINAADKKRLNIGYGVRIRDLDNERLIPYAKELKGGIILSVNNVKATDVKTVSQLLQAIDDGQNVQIEMITATGQLVRFLL